MVKTLIFLVKIDFLMFRPTNFLVRSQNIVVTKFLSQSPFHSNAKISCSTLFHSNFMLNSVPFQQHFMVSHDCIVNDSLDLPAPLSATPSCLTSVSLSVHWEQLQYFTNDVGSRVIRQVSWVLKPVEWITCYYGNQGYCGKRIELHPSAFVPRLCPAFRRSQYGKETRY